MQPIGGAKYPCFEPHSMPDAYASLTSLVLYEVEKGTGRRMTEDERLINTPEHCLPRRSFAVLGLPPLVSRINRARHTTSVYPLIFDRHPS